MLVRSRISDWVEGAGDDIADFFGFRHMEEASTYSGARAILLTVTKTHLWTARHAWKLSMLTAVRAGPAGSHSMRQSLPWTTCASQLAVYATL
jgi:hypothetical protein